MIDVQVLQIRCCQTEALLPLETECSEGLLWSENMHGKVPVVSGFGVKKNHFHASNLMAGA